MHLEIHWVYTRILVFVDDAISHLIQLRFVKSELMFTYFEATRGYLEKHDKPRVPLMLCHDSLEGCRRWRLQGRAALSCCLYPLSFKLPLCWLRSFTPVT
ncbi:hypothetical protein CKY12_02160 [Photorhabdus sp. S12-55]|nr:hypothetical protein PluDJC_07535 [Photorhabdus laumondii subsp. laumondii]RAW74224.1 hypothetical protein CKY14_06445 [Photorhabdus sp. S14-60]RAW74778.1 hypothetical protein CKY15_03165 [Photorhabdus sp. S7-51]RAW80099.1 hypothetical protein CKY06_02685 [Photorhabdus sp. S15-56]RAW88806.1 hypothetical protein CKY09_02560 [Photorhabdus sp. S5P8-50]RAW89081.1 hypothetical protein CKY12_02160 [Photorhabdus sp. S12-55]